MTLSQKPDGSLLPGAPASTAETMCHSSDLALLRPCVACGASAYSRLRFPIGRVGTAGSRGWCKGHWVDMYKAAQNTFWHEDRLHTHLLMR